MSSHNSSLSPAHKNTQFCSHRTTVTAASSMRRKGLLKTGPKQRMWQYQQGTHVAAMHSCDSIQLLLKTQLQRCMYSVQYFVLRWPHWTPVLGAHCTWRPQGVLMWHHAAPCVPADPAALGTTTSSGRSPQRSLGIAITAASRTCEAGPKPHSSMARCKTMGLGVTTKIGMGPYLVKQSSPASSWGAIYSRMLHDNLLIAVACVTPVRRHCTVLL
jgi:hypothetical protein